MNLSVKLGGRQFHFLSVKEVLAKANEEKSGDRLAGIAAQSELERVAAKHCLAALTLEDLRANPVLPAEDELTKLVDAALDEAIFVGIKNWTVAELREWLLNEATESADIATMRPALNGEMVAAVTKLMSNMDLVLAARKASVVVKAKTTLGLPGRLAARLQPNHPSDSLEGIRASIFEGLSYGVGDAVIGINPVLIRPIPWRACLTTRPP